MKNTTIFVKSKFKPIMTGKKITVGTGKYKDGIFGKKELTKKGWHTTQTGVSDCEIDGEQLSKDIQQAIAKLNTNGYEVISITEITSGKYDWLEFPCVGHTGGYGISYTEGVIIIAKETS
ncbi:MAG: hypothetical protein L3J71_03185 [Victivallaceae bacterium]|nr:hypothetical protein [Victivallaceae bacterium]